MHPQSAMLYRFLQKKKTIPNRQWQLLSWQRSRKRMHPFKMDRSTTSVSRPLPMQNQMISSTGKRKKICCKITWTTIPMFPVRYMHIDSWRMVTSRTILIRFARRQWLHQLSIHITPMPSGIQMSGRMLLQQLQREFVTITIGKIPNTTSLKILCQCGQIPIRMVFPLLIQIHMFCYSINMKMELTCWAIWSGMQKMKPWKWTNTVRISHFRKAFDRH